MKVKNKVFVLTGAGAGIGRELCIQLIEAGAKVLAVDYNKQSLEETYRLLPSRKQCSTYTVDVSSQDQVNAFVNAVLAEHDYVDGVINNAGIIHPFKSFWDMPLSQMERVFNVNWWGIVYMLRAFIPHLLERPEAHIINTSSMGGYLPVPQQSAYGASKAAVKVLTEGLMVELQDTAIEVSVVYPGMVLSNNFDNAPDMDEATKAKLHKQFDGSNAGLKPVDAAAIIMKGIEKGNPRILVGADCKLMDKLYRISPVRTSNFLAKKITSSIPQN